MKAKSVLSIILLFYNFNFVFSTLSAGTIYLPCGLGMKNLLYFEKVNNCNLWKGVLNVGFYENLRTCNCQSVVSLSILTPVTVLCSVPPYKPMYTDVTRVDYGIKATEYYFYWMMPHNDIIPILNNITVNGMRVCGAQTYLADLTTEDPVTESTTKSIQDENQSLCGRRKVNPYVNLVSNGNVAEPGQWPWHAAVFLLSTRYTNPKFRCGGTIISKKVVVTAAHCVMKLQQVYQAKRFLLKAGVTDLTDDYCQTCQSSLAKNLIPYPDYSKSNRMQGDIALIILKTKFDWTDYVQPICIDPGPSKSQLAGEYGTIAGFGATENSTKSDELMYAEVEIQPDQTCYDSDRIFFSQFLSEFSFCAGNGADSDVGPGTGDSGGGLYLSKQLSDGTLVWSLRGIVSLAKPMAGTLSTRMADIHNYVIYTRLSMYISWITNTVVTNDWSMR